MKRSPPKKNVGNISGKVWHFCALRYFLTNDFIISGLQRLWQRDIFLNVKISRVTNLLAKCLKHSCITAFVLDFISWVSAYTYYWINDKL